MSVPPPEFSRPTKPVIAARSNAVIDLVADADERAALARRFAWLAIDWLEASVRLEPADGDATLMTGVLKAQVTQACVATGEPVPETIETDFAIRLVPGTADVEPEPGSEIEIDAADTDSIFYTGEEADLGEAIAETLALAVDPWPRVKNAEDVLRKAGVKREEDAAIESGPFAALAALKTQGKKD